MGYDVRAGVEHVMMAFTAWLEYGGGADYVLLSPGAERHGTWEWQAMRPDPPLRRYIVLSISNLEREDGPRDAEVRVGIDDERSYARRIVARRLIRDFELQDFLSLAMPTAMDVVTAMTEEDLNQLYGQRRLFPPDQTSATV